MNQQFLRLAAAFVAVIGISLTSFQSADAQIRASEFSSISQTIDGTVITIEYSRPSRRGRDVLFGGVIPFDDVRTPGANWATTLEVNKDVTINSINVTAGKYSVWMVATEGAWEVGLFEEHRMFHAPHPVMEDAAVRIPVEPRQSATELETLTFHFPSVRTDGATLRLQWGATYGDMSIGVQSTQQFTVSDVEAARFEGTYRIDMAARPPFSAEANTQEIEISRTGRYLQTQIRFGPYDALIDIGFAPKADQVFLPFMVMGNEPAQLFDMMLFEFQTDSSGRAESFKARFTADDSVWITGTRAD